MYVASPGSERIGSPGWPRCFPGYETNARFLTLSQSGLKVRCIESGWLWDTTGLDSDHFSAFVQILGQSGFANEPGTSTEWISPVNQQNGIDQEDRIIKGATILKALIGVGL